MEEIPTWIRTLQRAVKNNKKNFYGRWMQLATIREDGRPANRTVVYRGLLEENSPDIKIVTDARSAKIHQTATNDWAEICWCFEETSEQFRILGKIKTVLPDDPDPTWQNYRRMTWKELSTKSKQIFAVPHPGIPKHQTEDFGIPDDQFDYSEPNQNFALCVISAHEVDYLCLRGNQFRSFHERKQDGSWMTTELNP